MIVAKATPDRYEVESAQPRAAAGIPSESKYPTGGCFKCTFTHSGTTAARIDELWFSST
jgi:hypothetical protein